jgi:hypothetical protein
VTGALGDFLGYSQGEMPSFGVVRREPTGGGRGQAAATTAPRVREHCHPTYYAAFVRDLDGNDIQAVCHKPPQD